MKALKIFTINFASLADGEHLFEYQIDNKFLKHFETALVQEGNIDVNLSLLKFLNSLELSFTIQGNIVVPCDICNEEFELPIQGSEQIMVKIVHEIPAENDESNIVYLKEGNNSINIAEMLYELLMLSIPMRKIHPLNEDGSYSCNAEVLKYLQLGEDIEISDSEIDDNDNINPIWDELKKLK